MFSLGSQGIFHRFDHLFCYNYKKSLNDWSLGEQWILLPWNLGKQNSLFPSGPLIVGRIKQLAMAT